MTFILNQNGTCAIPLGQIKRLYIEHGENWYKIMALVHPCDNDKRKINLGIFKRLEAAQSALTNILMRSSQGRTCKVADDELNNKDNEYVIRNKEILQDLLRLH